MYLMIEDTWDHRIKSSCTPSPTPQHSALGRGTAPKGGEKKLHLRRWKRRGGWNSKASVDWHTCFLFVCFYLFKGHLKMTVCTQKA